MGAHVRTTVPGRREIVAERQRLRRRYKTVYDDLTRILFAHDPIGVAYVPDEYEPEVSRILARAKDVRSESDLTAVIHSVFVEMFGSSTAGDRGKYGPIARELWPLIRP